MKNCLISSGVKVLITEKPSVRERSSFEEGVGTERRSDHTLRVQGPK